MVLDDGLLQALSLFHPTRRLPPPQGWFFADRADPRSLRLLFLNSLEIITFDGLRGVFVSSCLMKVRENEDLAIRKNILPVGRKINYQEEAFVKREKRRERGIKLF